MNGFLSSKKYFDCYEVILKMGHFYGLYLQRKLRHNVVNPESWTNEV